jgi:hypothetical protein
MTQPILQARQVVALNIPLKRGLRVHYMNSDSGTKTLASCHTDVPYSYG